MSSQINNAMNDIECNATAAATATATAATTATANANAKSITNPLSKSISLNNCYQYGKTPRSDAHTFSQYTTQTNAKQSIDPLRDRSNAMQQTTNTTQKL